MEKRYYNQSAIMGLVVGDALGVPVEFSGRQDRKNDPVTGMRAYGTHHQPAGTWSDDSSMTVATMEWYAQAQENQGDYTALMNKFVAWISKGDYTPYGTNFDNGIATMKALLSFGRGVEPLQCGGMGERDNGNGSLMRILPAALVNMEGLKGELVTSVQKIYEMSALTHAHPRSKSGCLIYSKLIADLLKKQMTDQQCEGKERNTTDDAAGISKIGKEEKYKIVQESLRQSQKYLAQDSDPAIRKEAESYCRLWDVSALMALPEKEISSSGYVVHTLEAAVWCFLTTDSYAECVLKAVNLGDDTDTVGAVAGGIAGCFYGLNGIPKEWMEIIPKKEWILELAAGL